VSHSIFQAAVEAANLTDAVLSVSSFTMFIPSDEVRDGCSSQLAACSSCPLPEYRDRRRRAPASQAFTAALVAL
jgi:hypothetical protein